MITLHIAGGSSMIRDVVSELSDIPLLRPKVLGVSVLTSFDDVRWAEVTKAMTDHASTVSDSVAGLVDSAVSWGVDGIVCSALELSAIRSRYPNLYTVVPGIRMQGADTHDQARVTSPGMAKELGASAIVMGRPITESPNPGQVVHSVLRELSFKHASSQ
jgi:orotidine-5'-phosphate decarboxylase